jgi:hypothetical protein
MLLPTTACEIIDTWTVGGPRDTGSHDVAVRDVSCRSNLGRALRIRMSWPSPLSHPSSGR